MRLDAYYSENLQRQEVCMGKVGPGEESDLLWKKVELLIPLVFRDPNRKDKPGIRDGSKPLPVRLVLFVDKP